MKTANYFGKFHAPPKSYQAKKNQGSADCISTGRTYRHLYNVSVRTKPVRKELRPRLVAGLTGPGQAGAGQVCRKHRRCAV